MTKHWDGKPVKYDRPIHPLDIYEVRRESSELSKRWRRWSIELSNGRPAEMPEVEVEDHWWDEVLPLEQAFFIQQGQPELFQMQDSFGNPITERPTERNWFYDVYDPDAKPPRLGGPSGCGTLAIALIAIPTLGLLRCLA